jgi:hypothetical protein
MKTDQLMKVAFPLGDLDIFHKSQWGNLTQLFSIGNKQRILEDRPPINITHFLASKKTKEFIQIVSKEVGIEENEVIRKKKGKRGTKIQMQAQLHFLIFAAEHLSPTFHFQVIDTFINSKLLQLRDDGGNNFKRLNRYIDSYLGGREDKTSNMGCYIHAAKLLREKIFPNIKMPDGNIWNTDQATAHHQELRTRYEDKLCTLLEMDVVKDFEHLKTFIAKL